MKHVSWIVCAATLAAACGEEGDLLQGADGGSSSDAQDASVDVGGMFAVDAPVAFDGGTADAMAAEDAAGDGIAEGDAGKDAGPAICELGEARSEATASNLALFGSITYFNDGAPLLAGTYVVTYQDGCMKYGGGQGWTVNAYAPGGCCNWWLVGETSSDKKVGLPGNLGFNAPNGAHANFEDCVAAGKQKLPVTFEHAGGKLGVWLQDSPYTDNSAGLDGRNPKWSLARMGACVP